MIVLDEIGPNEWMFIESPCVPASMDKFDFAVQILEEENLEAAEKVLREIIEKCPDHIDAIHHLAIIADMQGRSLEHILLEKTAVETGLSNAPPRFNLKSSTLEWCRLKNRPFLRAYYGLAGAYLTRGSLRQASDMFSNLLSLNPTDNQGARQDAIWCCFQLEMPEQVLLTCSQFPEDTLPETLYGRPLAHIKLGQISEGKICLAESIRWLPSIARELLKARHVIPGRNLTKYIADGSREDAYEYWKRFGKFWESTNEAIAILKEVAKQKLGKEPMSNL